MQAPLGDDLNYLIDINSNENLKSLHGLENLHGSMCGGIQIEDNDVLVDIAALEGVSEFLGEVFIRNNPILPSLEGFHNVAIVENLYIQSNSLVESLEGFRGLQQVRGTIFIARNPQLISIAGLRNIERCEQGMYIRGSSIQSVEKVGSRIVFNAWSNVKIDSSPFCLPESSDHTPGESAFLSDPGVKLPDLTWDDEICTLCEPACADTMCDYRSGMCMCHQKYLGGPNCEFLPEIGFDETQTLLVTIPEPAEGTSVEIVELPLVRERATYMDSPATPKIIRLPERSSGPRRLRVGPDGPGPDDEESGYRKKSLLSESDDFVSSVEWFNETQGVIRFLFAVTRYTDRTAAEDIRIGLQMDESIAYPDGRVRLETSATIRVTPYGGYLAFRAPVVTLSESDIEANCTLIIERIGGSGGDTNATIAFVEPQESSSSICRQQGAAYGVASIISDFDVKVDTLELFWEDGDASPRCVDLPPVDDNDVEQDEILCAAITSVRGGACVSTDVNQIHALVTLVDDDEAPGDHTVTYLTSAVAVALFVASCVSLFGYCYKRKQEKLRWIPLRKAVEAGCSVDHLLRILEAELHVVNPKIPANEDKREERNFLARFSSNTSSATHPKDKHQLSTTNVHQDPRIHENPKFAKSWHYLMQSDNDMCLSVTRKFVEAHKDLIQHLAHLKDCDGRKAINVALARQKKVLEKYLLFIGRYRIKSGPVIHRSRTCEVIFAVDVHEKTSEYPDGRPVAIKLMRDKRGLEREIRSRTEFGDLNRNRKTVVGVLGFHLPNGEAIFGAQPRFERMADSARYPYALVLERADDSAFHVILTQRVAGLNACAIGELALKISTCVSALHDAGLCHLDLKLRNVLVTKDKVLLCDLDAASGTHSKRSKFDKLGSSAYRSPECTRWYTAWKDRLMADGSEATDDDDDATPPLVVDTSMDVWSLGVVLFELCAGSTLFAQDLNNDSLKLSADEMRLALWSCIPDERLDSLFPSSPKCSSEQRHAAAHLIRWCLRGDPKMRPSMDDMLRHPFLSSSLSPTSLALTTPQPMHHHLFISHMQAEASGDVGTLCLSLEKLGLNCWRDMTASDLTEDGMRRGVKRSDAFVLFL
eukprot:g1023.t1